MRQCSSLFDDLIDLVKQTNCRGHAFLSVSDKWHFDNNGIATVKSEKTPQVKTACWKCPVMSVYINTMDNCEVVPFYWGQFPPLPLVTLI